MTGPQKPYRSAAQRRHISAWSGDRPVTASEERLVHAYLEGTLFPASGVERPDDTRPDLVINAALLAQIILAKAASGAGVPLEVVGYRITGALRVNNISCPFSVTLSSCTFDSRITINGCALWSLDLSRSSFPGADLEGNELRRDLLLHGVQCCDATETQVGCISLIGAVITGSLMCHDAKFTTPNRPGIDADGTKIGRDIEIRSGQFDSPIRCIGAFIDGDVTFTDTKVANGAYKFAYYDEIVSIGIDRIEILGGLYIRRCTLSGQFKGSNIHVKGPLDLSGSTLNGPAEMLFKANGARIDRSLNVSKVTTSGKFDLSNAHVQTIVDCDTFWTSNIGDIDGFVYDNIESSVNNRLRIAALCALSDSNSPEAFHSQPWEQLVRVLRGRGDTVAAGEVAIAKQRQLRSIGAIGNRKPSARERNPVARWLNLKWNPISNWSAKRLHDFYGWTSGYGHRPFRIAGRMITLWLVATLLFWLAAWGGIMAPASADVIMHEQLHSDIGADSHDSSRCGIRYEVNPPQYWPDCAALPSEYTTFNPAVYSLDLILPLVDLGQESSWAPSATYTDSGGEVQWLWWGMGIRALMWFEILFGWFASLMFVAIVSRLVDKD